MQLTLASSALLLLLTTVLCETCNFDQPTTVLVDTSTSNLRSRSSVAAVKSLNSTYQRFVTVWAATSDSQSNNSIYASIYGVSTNETFLDVAKIQVSQGQAECLNPTVSTIVTGGGFVVVWEAVVSVSDTRLPKQRRVRFRLFDYLGVPVGSEVVIGDDAGSIADPRLDSRPAVSTVYVKNQPHFVVAWLRTYFPFSNQSSILNPYTDLLQQGSNSASVTVVLSQIFSYDTLPLTNSTRVNVDFPFDDSMGWASRVTTAFLPDSNFIVAWADMTCSGSRIYAQLFYAGSAHPVGPTFLVSGSQTQDYVDPSMVRLRGGDIAVSWTAQNNNGSKGSVIMIQLLSKMSTKIGRPFTAVPNPSGLQGASSLTSLLNGNFMITWNEIDANDSSVYARIFNGSTPVGDSFSISQEQKSLDYLPDVVALSGNQIVVSWNHNSQEIVASVYKCTRNCVTSSWTPFSTCRGPCEQPGVSVRSRNINAEAVLGGIACDLVQTTQIVPCAGGPCTLSIATAEPNGSSHSTVVPYANIRRMLG